MYGRLVVESKARDQGNCQSVRKALGLTRRELREVPCLPDLAIPSRQARVHACPLTYV